MMIVASNIKVLVRATLAFTLAGCLMSVSAGAVSVTNRDDKEQKIQIVEGDVKKDHALKPAAVLEGVCMKGCVIRLNDNDNDEYELDGTEVVTIEDGYLYYDGPDAPAPGAPASNAPAQGAAPTPAPKAP
jgi:hypothetical protein